VAYELAKQGASVLLVEAEAEIAGATRYSYGGIAYWAGTTPLTRELCEAAKFRHPLLSEELGYDTQFREMELLLTVEAGKNPVEVARQYTCFMTQPEVLTPKAAQEREPLLNLKGIGGALAVPHGHVCPQAMARAYRQAFERLGGKIRIGRVEQLLREGDRVTAVQVEGEAIAGKHVILSAGAWSREILRQQGIVLPLYFSHAEMLELPREAVQGADVRMQRLVMPAEQKRFDVEAKVGQAEFAAQWEAGGEELMPPVLDAGVIQFEDGHIAMGQISRMQTSPGLTGDAVQGEIAIRSAVRQILPAIADIPGQWHSTLVAFSGDGLPLIGPVPGLENLMLFSGFSSPFVYAIPLAERFARCSDLASDPWLGQMLPERFA
jgi:glycine/D-amino acid oxidase-like deaminating enzyme